MPNLWLDLDCQLIYVYNTYMYQIYSNELLNDLKGAILNSYHNQILVDFNFFSFNMYVKILFKIISFHMDF